MTRPNITAPSDKLATLVANHELIMDTYTDIDTNPGQLAALDQLVAETTSELADFGIDTADPTTAHTLLAFAHVLEARAERYLSELDCDMRHVDCVAITANEAMTDGLVGACESAARQAG